MSLEVSTWADLEARAALTLCRDGYGGTVRSCDTNAESRTHLYPSCSIIREATAKSKDGRIGQSEFLDHCVSSTRYSLFTPMEASIIFHFAGRGNAQQRLSLLDFAQLLDPRWKAPSETVEFSAPSFLEQFAHSAYNFGLGGWKLRTVAVIDRSHARCTQVSRAALVQRSCTPLISVRVCMMLVARYWLTCPSVKVRFASCGTSVGHR